MRTLIIFLLVYCLAFPFSHIAAQIIAFDNPEADLQRARIGLIDEFMKRFNGDEIHPDIELSHRDSVNTNLIWLFNHDQFLDQDQNIQDSIRTEAMNLIKIIKNNSIKINYSDSTWAAIAHCKGIVMGKEENFDMFLTVQSRGDGMYKWVINAVAGECFNVDPRDVNENLIISPEAHETKFISLHRISKEQPYNIRLFMSKNTEYDPTSTFAYLVYSGKLKIEYVQRLEFFFLQVPNYAFHVQYFDRPSNNSGWLISNFYHFSDSDKAEFRKMIHQKAPVDNAFANDISSEDSVKVIPDSIAVDIPASILRDRVNERIGMLQDYISYIDSCSSKASQQYYTNKLLNLFSPDAKAIIKISRTGETKVMDLKKFAEVLSSKKFANIIIEAITSVIFTRSATDNDEPIVLATGIIPFSIMTLDEVLNTEYYKKLLGHFEETEDGIEYIFDFGDIYISVK
jgi:hypothetical protein